MLTLMAIFILMIYGLMANVPLAPHGPFGGALDAESPKSNEKKNEQMFDHEINVLFMDLRHILNARSCNHFLSFPHTPKPPRPLKQPIILIYFCIFSTLFVWLTF